MKGIPENNYLNAARGIKSWLLTLDHKRIGVLYLFSIMAAFLVGGVFAIMIFLFIIPSIPAALGNFVLPQMIGARDVAFPRLNLASWWVYILGSAFAVYSIASGSIDTGWTFYTPYSTESTGSVVSMTLGVFILGFSSIFTGLNFIVTIHKMRAPGQTWFKLPLFVWGLYATAIIQVLATPVLGITLILLILERVASIGIFDPAMGGDPVLYQHFFWFYSHPAVYIMILPGMGIISELVSVFSHKKIFGYKAIAFSSLAIAFISFLVWGHHMFVSGQSQLAAMLFSLLTFLVGIPSGIKVFNWLATMYRGRISFEAPMLYTLSFLFLFTIGGLTGIFLGALAVDVHLHDTYFVVAHFHYVMMGGTVMAFLGGLHYWWPKIWGRLYSELWARIAAVLIFVGFNMTFFTQFILGARGMPRRYYSYLDQYQPLHGFSSVGSWVMGLGFIIMGVYLVHAIFKGRPAGNNPWGALTFEWQTTSPPPKENFTTPPVLAHGPYDYDKIVPERTA